jgi:hypothetical protein
LEQDITKGNNPLSFMKQFKNILGPLILLCSYAVHGQTINSNAVGNWNQGATWVGGVVPGAGNDVIIHHAVTISDDRNANSVTIINDAAQTSSLSVTGGNSVIGAGGVVVTGDANAFSSELRVTGGTLRINGNLSFTNSVIGNSASVLRLDNAAQLTVNGNFSYTHQPSDNITENRTEINIDRNSVFNLNGNLNLIYNSALKNSTLSFLLELDASLNVSGNVSLITTESGTNTGTNRVQFAFGTNSVSTCSMIIGGNLGLYNDDTSVPAFANRNVFDARDNTIIDIYGDIIFDAKPTTASNRSNRIIVRNSSQLTLGSSNVLDPLYNPLGGDIVFSSATGTLSDNRVEIGESGIFDINGNVSNSTHGQIEPTGTSSVYFSGRIAQEIFRVQPNFVNLRIDNSSGVALTLAANTTVSANLDMTNGIIDTAGPDRFLLADAATCTGGTTTSYIINGVTKVGLGAITLPVGAGTHWAPVALSNIIGGSVNLTGFQVNFFLGTHAIGATDGTFDHRDGAEYWQVQLVSVGANPLTPPTSMDVIFHWKDACFSQIEDITAAPQDLFIGGLVPATRWELIGNSTIIGGSQACNAGDVTPETGSIRVSLATANFATYTHYTFVALDPFLNPLPVELAFFDVHANESNEAIIFWETASELNNWKFVVEKSSDGINWSPVAELDGMGTSSVGKGYSAIDSNPYPSTSYYRLAQYEFDGTLTYSSIKSLTIPWADKLIVSIHPNPSTDVLHISTTDFLDNIVVHFYDATGTVLMANFFPEFGRKQTFDIHSLQSGKYLVSLSRYGRRLDSKLIVVLK